MAERRQRMVKQGSSQGSGLWTPANIVTCVRIGLMPLWLVVAEFSRPSAFLSWLSFSLYVVIAVSDKVDGYLARSRNEVTNFGKFLDPIADKLAVVIAMLFLLERNLMPSWFLVVVIAREFLVSGLRMLVASEGTVVAASGLGKAKTAFTMVSLCFYLLYLCLPQVGAIYTIGQVLMYVAIALTAWSGIDYFVKAWPALSR